jgi:glycosyltransferase involved in cell wall biosynthesis
MAGLVGLRARLQLGIPYLLDCHSGVFLSRSERWLTPLRWLVLGFAQTLIVHNDENIPLARTFNANVGRLQDPVFVFPDRQHAVHSEVNHPAAVYVCSWRPDEPVELVCAAARHLRDVTFYITGSPKWSPDVPPNVRLTGFLDVDAYVSLLERADVVLALTTRESVMLCAAHEAIALGRPLVVSATRVLRERFGAAATIAEPLPERLAAAVQHAIAEAVDGASRSHALGKKLDMEWWDETRRLGLSSGRMASIADPYILAAPRRDRDAGSLSEHHGRNSGS